MRRLQQGGADYALPLDASACIPNPTESRLVDVTAAVNSLGVASHPLDVLDDRERLRAKNRLAQQRCREKAKARLASSEQLLAERTRELAAAKLSLAAKQAEVAEARQRLKDLKASALQTSEELRQELLRSIASGPPASSQGPFRAPPPRRCPLFRVASSEGRPLPHAASVSLGRLDGDGPQLQRRLAAFQARVARRLRCDAADVSWLYDCTFRPITREAPIPSNLHTLGCKGHGSLVWMAARVECAMLLAIWTRIDRASTALPLQPLLDTPLGRVYAASLAPAAVTAVGGFAERGVDQSTAPRSPRSRASAAPQPRTPSSAGRPAVAPHSPSLSAPGRHSIAEQRTAGASAAPELAAALERHAADALASDESVEEPIEELSDRVFAFFLGDSGKGGAPAAEGGSARDVARYDRPGGLAAFVRLVREVLGAIFEEYVPLMHPADVVLLAKRLTSSAPPNVGDGMPIDEEAPLTTGAGFGAVLSEVAALSRRAAATARSDPRVPALPATQEDASRRKSELEARMGLVYSDWSLVYTLTMVGAPVWTFRAGAGFNPASAGLAKFEQRNLKAYEQLALSTEQKRTVAAALQLYRSRCAELADDTAALASLLGALPSADELPRPPSGELRAPSAPAAAVPATLHGTVHADRAHPPAAPLQTVHSSPPAFGAASDAPAGPSAAGPSRAPDRTTDAAAVLLPGAAGAAGSSDWAQEPLGACPDATQAAGDVLEGLQHVLAARHGVHADFLCAFKEALTPRQQASWFTAQLPFVADAWRIAAMAAADLGRDRVYGPRRIGPPGS